MKRLSVIIVRVLVIASSLSAAYTGRPAKLTQTGLDHWNRIGNANWRLEDGVVQAPTQIFRSGPRSGLIRLRTAASSYAVPTRKRSAQEIPTR